MLPELRVLYFEDLEVGLSETLSKTIASAPATASHDPGAESTRTKAQDP
jgi:hypothetical protein